MENDTKEIISVVNIDKRETGRNSVIMEREAFIKTFDRLHAELNLSEVCTDAHIQIGSLFSKTISFSSLHYNIFVRAKVASRKASRKIDQCVIL